MYYVYQLSFGDRKYIGCTNDLRRRKDQHNGNAKARKSKLGVFLSESGIILSLDDFVILASFELRKDALAYERQFTISLANQGSVLLNDNYSQDCTRKGKNIGNTAKEYVVIDYTAHIAIPVKDLRQFCLRKGIDYKAVQRTTRKGHYCQQGYKAFYVKDWKGETDKEKYLSGSFISEIEKNARSIHTAKTCKSYIVRFPDGHTETIKNADKFAREHGLSSGTLHATFIKNKPTKGYQIIERI